MNFFGKVLIIFIRYIEKIFLQKKLYYDILFNIFLEYIKQVLKSYINIFFFIFSFITHDLDMYQVRNL
jgi:hypothetical protein